MQRYHKRRDAAHSPLSDEMSCSSDREFVSNDTRFRRYKQKLRHSWLSHPRLRGWLLEHAGVLFCNYCHCRLQSKLSGLLSHAETAKHRCAVEAEGSKSGRSMKLCDDDIVTTTTRKKRTLWTELCENVLLELWKNNLEQFNSSQKSEVVYQEIRLMLNMQCDSKFSVYEIRSKIHNLTSRYKKERDIVRAGGKSAWPYYTRISAIYNNYQLRNPKNKTNDTAFQQIFLSELTENDIKEDASADDSQPPPSYETFPEVQSAAHTSEGDAQVAIVNAIHTIGEQIDRHHAELLERDDELLRCEHRKVKLMEEFVHYYKIQTDALREYVKK